MLRYRIYWGGPGMLTWAFHRISGLGVLLFLFLHILDTSLILLGAEAYETFVVLYRAPLIRLLEVLLALAVVYHGGNGIRITLYDLRPSLVRFDRYFFYAGLVVYPLLVVPMAYAMLQPVFFPGLPRLGG